LEPLLAEGEEKAKSYNYKNKYFAIYLLADLSSLSKAISFLLFVCGLTPFLLKYTPTNTPRIWLFILYILSAPV
jgi:hypothetical protein